MGGIYVTYVADFDKGQWCSNTGVVLKAKYDATASSQLN